MKDETARRKIINDPVHGFININGGLLYDLIQDPWFQRLRYIRQLGLTDNVYPGASHTRFIHSIGSLCLVNQAIAALRLKGINIEVDEEEALQVAILFHDVGHGPFSHALEHLLVNSISHEDISLFIMKIINREYNDRLSMAIEMFTGKYHRKFFHDLISSQIDMDRLDYLVRDSFFTGVIEGSVGADRIIKMLNVYDDRLVVEEKGIYSIEKFLIARRLMYWQVYMHKTVISAEKLLVNIIKRARELVFSGFEPDSGKEILFFLHNNFKKDEFIELNERSDTIAANFLAIDDNELVATIRKWTKSRDSVLADLSQRLLYRNFFAIELSSEPFSGERLEKIDRLVCEQMKIDREVSNYYVFSGSVSNLTYAPSAPRVRILDKRGVTREITEVSDILDHKALSREITKFYICYPKEIRDL